MSLYRVALPRNPFPRPFFWQLPGMAACVGGAGHRRAGSVPGGRLCAGLQAAAGARAASAEPMLIAARPPKLARSLVPWGRNTCFHWYPASAAGVACAGAASAGCI